MFSYFWNMSPFVLFRPIFLIFVWSIVSFPHLVLLFLVQLYTLHFSASIPIMTDNQCTIDQNAKCVCWPEELKSLTTVRSRSHQEFGGDSHRYCSSRMSINHLHEKFFEIDSILRSTMVRTKSVRIGESESMIVNTCKEDSHMSFCRAANKLSISKNSISRVLQDHSC